MRFPNPTAFVLDLKAFTLLLMLLAGLAWAAPESAPSSASAPASDAAAPAALPAPPPDLTALLPPETLLVVRVRSVPDLLQKWEGSPFFRFFGDPRAGAFFGPLRDKIGAFKQSMDTRSGVSADRLWNFFSGEFIMAGLPAPAGARQPMTWVMLFAHNGDAQLIEKFKQTRVPPGASVQRTTERAGGIAYTRVHLIREVPADVSVKKSKSSKHKNKKKLSPALPGVIDSDDGSDPGAGGPDPSIGDIPAVPLKRQVAEEFDDYFGPSLIVHAEGTGEPMRQVLNRLAHPGAAPAFAGRPELARLREGAASDIEVFADAAALGRWFQERAATGPVQFGALRLEEIKALRLGLNLQRDRVAANVAVLAPEPRQGLARLLFLPAVPAPANAGLVPEDTVVYWSSGISAAELWRAALDLLKATAPMIHATLTAQLQGFEQQSGVKLDRDLFGALGGGLSRFLVPEPVAAKGGPRNPREMATYMIGVKNPAALKSSIQGLLAYGAQAYGAYRVETGTLGDWPLWTLYPGPAGAQARPVLHLCLADRWLLVGARRAGIDAAAQRLRGQKRPRPLEELKAYKAVTRELPAGRVWEAFINTGGIRRLVDSGIFDQKKSKGGWLPVNPRAIPDQALWSEYFGPAGGAITREGDLLRLRAFILYP